MLHDSNADSGGMIPITQAEAKVWNKQGYGIHWAVNDFKDRRNDENVTRINAWFYEVDDLPKSSQFLLIETGLYPSMVVESKNSYHVYFFTKEDAKHGKKELDTFREIQRRLVYHYGADNKLIAPCRTLRAPGYNHLKDPKDPFPVSTIWFNPQVSYTPEIMLYFFSEVPAKEIPEHRLRDTIPQEAHDYFGWIDSLDQMACLTEFSGSKWVNGEEYRFKRNANGNYNIIVNGKGVSCFIDKNHMIAATGSGPTIYHWLKYYNHTHQEIKKAITEVIGSKP